MSSKSNNEEYKINLCVDIITDETNSKILTSFFKFILLHYNIIPFRFEIFKYYADGFKKIQDDGNNKDDLDWNMAQITKQQDLVIELSDDINYLIREIHSEFKSSMVSELAIFYGTTVLTPKEIYLFRCLTNASHHLSENHNVKDGTILKCLTQFVSNVMTNANGKSKISNNTNLYILYKKSTHEINSDLSKSNEYLYKNDEITDIMDSCRNKYVFELNNEIETENYSAPNCCKELIVYEDLCNLNLVESVEEKPAEKEVVEPLEWYQSKITLKRYECRKIRGKEVWEYL